MNTSKKIISLLMCMLMVLTMVPMSVFAIDLPIEIDTVALTMPEAEGETLNLDAIKVPDDAEYEIDKIEDFVVNGVDCKETDVVLVDADYVDITVRVNVKGEATFSDTLTATVNGNNAHVVNAPVSIKIRYEFYVGGGSGVVDTVDITMPEAPGETLNLDAIKVPDGAAYKVEYIDDFTVNGSNPHGERLLQRGDEVCIRLYIKARGTAEFADGMTATVNGKAATVSVKGSTYFKLTYEFTSNTVIDEINLTYDSETIDLNTAWTEGEVDRRVRYNVATTTEGASVDGGNSGLRIKQSETDFYGVGDGSATVDATKNYAILYSLYLSEGYDWQEAVKEYPYTGTKVKINGTDVTDEVYFNYNDYWNQLKVYYVIGNADTTLIVTDITVSDTVLSVAKGENHTFTADVKGTVADKTVTWSVEGATSAETVIDDATGKLTVGTDETAETVTVKATANADSSKFATATVTVTEQPPYISGVDVYPSVDELYTGAEKEFTVNVYGTQTDKSVKWIVEGATSAKTTIDSTGKLTIGSDETAATLTVKATANKDNTKFGTSTVTVKQKTRISEINVTYDLEKLELNTTVTERNVDANIKNNVIITDEGVIIDSGNSGLSIRQENGDYWGIGDGSAKVSVDKNYAIKVRLGLTNACDWPESVKSSTPSGITVKINGVDLTDEVDLDYNSAYNSLTVYVSLEKATCPHTYDNDCDAECNNCHATRTPAAHTGGTATCTQKAKCSVCGEAYGSLKSHTYKTVTTKATLSKNGKIESKCSCGKVKSTQTIAKIGSVTLSATKYIHDGKNKTPTVTVKDANGKKLVKNTDYKLSIASKRSGIGKYTVKVTFIGKYSGSKNVYFTILPGKPASVKSAAQTTSSVKLTWSKVSGAAGYTVYRYSPSKKAYVKAGTTEGTSLTVKGLLTGTKYTFKVVAYGKTSGGKVYNSEGYTLLKTATKTKTPAISKITTTKGKAVLTHTNVSGETGYTVYYSTKKDSGFKKYANFKADTTRCDITKLTSGKTYYFKVRTYIKTDSGYVYSPWSAVKGIKVK